MDDDRRIRETYEETYFRLMHESDNLDRKLFPAAVREYARAQYDASEAWNDFCRAVVAFRDAAEVVRELAERDAAAIMRGENKGVADG